MARIDLMIPFILLYETGTAQEPGESPEALYARAARHGFSQLLHDTGGATMCGVTLSTYRAWCARHGHPRPSVHDLRELPYGRWLEVLKELFWDRWKADSIHSQSVAEMLVDWVWTSGRYGIVLPQHILGVRGDGIVGPATLAAVNRQNPRRLFARLRDERIAFVKSIVAHHHTQERFLRGWERRINAIPYKD